MRIRRQGASRHSTDTQIPVTMRLSVGNNSGKTYVWETSPWAYGVGR
jgi:hypothetical protein